MSKSSSFNIGVEYAASATLAAAAKQLTRLALMLTCLLAPTLAWAQNAYIANTSAGTVSVINTTTNTVVATIPGVGTNPIGVAVSPNGSKVYVGDAFISNEGVSKVFVIDTATNTVVASIPVGFGAAFVAISPNGSKLYVSNHGTTTVAVVDTATNTVSAWIQLSSNPGGLAVTPNGSKVYVADRPGNTVKVIDTATNSVSSIALGGGPFFPAVSPNGAKVYVSSADGSDVWVIDTATNTVVAQIFVAPAPAGLEGVAVSPDNSKVYVSVTAPAGGGDPDPVAVIDAATNTVSAFITVDLNPAGIAFTHDGSKAYVANQDSNNVSVINTATNTVIATIPVGTFPLTFGMFIQPSPHPSNKDQCKNGGYKNYVDDNGQPFKNQGQCVSYVNHP